MSNTSLQLNQAILSEYGLEELCRKSMIFAAQLLGNQSDAEDVGRGTIVGR